MMKSILLFSTLFFLSGTALADAIQDVTKSIRSVCAAPDQKSKFWNVNSAPNSRVNVKVLGANTQINGNISAGEWDGIQRVLRDQQASDNSNYRDCVKSLTPVFLKMVSKSNQGAKRKPVLVKGNTFSLDLSSYEEGDIPVELGENLVINKHGRHNMISGLSVSPSGYFEMKGLALQRKFRLEIVLDLNGYNNSSLILRTRDDDIDNDIAINFDRSNMVFGDKKGGLNERTGWKGSNGINELVIYMKNGVAKLYINDKYFASFRSDERNFYDKLILKNIEPNDYLFDVSGYNIDG